MHTALHWQIFRLNTLESIYLVSSLFVLLAGTTFQSGVTTTGGAANLALTYIVILVLAGCTCTIAGALAIEMYRSLCFAGRMWLTRKHYRASPELKEGSPSTARRLDEVGAERGWTRGSVCWVMGLMPLLHDFFRSAQFGSIP